MNKIIITGVAGFIGSHLAEKLLSMGNRIIGIDNLNEYYDPNFKKSNLKKLLPNSNFELIHGDIQRINLKNILTDADYIFHLAAQAGVRSSWGTGFGEYTRSNIDCTQLILEECKSITNLKKLIYSSSSSVYGNPDTFPTSENSSLQPVSPYGITKLAGEQLCQLYNHNFNVPTVCLRYFTVFGPRQRPDMAFHKFMKSIINGDPINVFGDGKQTRDFTYISDCVDAIIAAAFSSKTIGQIYNVGGGNSISLIQSLNLIQNITNQKLQINFQKSSKGDAIDTLSDTSKAKNDFNYNPKISLEEGLIEQWQWIQSIYTRLV